MNIIQIKNDNTYEVMESFQPNKFKTYKEMAEAILNEKIKVNYLYPISEKLLKSVLREGIELGY